MHLKLIFCFLPILFIQNGEAINWDSAKEMKCFRPEKFLQPNIEWATTVKKWYYVMMSKMDLYAITKDMTKMDLDELRDFGDDKVYYEGCVKWEVDWASGSINLDGFGGKKLTYKMSPGDHPGEALFGIGNDISGYGYISLTDNETFQLVLGCWTDYNEMAWYVASPLKTLPKKTVKLIHDHLKGLGFKEEFFTSLRYDGCDKVANERNEL